MYNENHNVCIVIIFVLVFIVAMLSGAIIGQHAKIEKQNTKIETLESIINDFKMENLK